jgi:hypothetical protein
MNYPANIQHWPLGAQVIHDADAKTAEMLMVVEGYTRLGQVITRYLHPHHYPCMKGRFVNDICYLHNPLLFGLCIQSEDLALSASPRKSAQRR